MKNSLKTELYLDRGLQGVAMHLSPEPNQTDTPERVNLLTPLISQIIDSKTPECQCNIPTYNLAIGATHMLNHFAILSAIDCGELPNDEEVVAYSGMIGMKTLLFGWQLCLENLGPEDTFEIFDELFPLYEGTTKYEKQVQDRIIGMRAELRALASLKRSLGEHDSLRVPYFDVPGDIMFSYDGVIYLVEVKATGGNTQMYSLHRNKEMRRFLPRSQKENLLRYCKAKRVHPVLFRTRSCGDLENLHMQFRNLLYN
jgi:hypothetical protein